MVDEEVDIIKQQKREKIGLIVFVLAIIGIFIAVYFYITASHSLDLTASNIDSNVGQLDGYLTIIFEGDNTVREKKTSDVDKILKRATDFFVGDDYQTKINEPESSDNIHTETATLENVHDFYRDKDSTICRIKCGDYNAYSHGEVFERGFWKIGVVSINQDFINMAQASSNASNQYKPLQDTIYKLRHENEVDLVIVLSPDYSCLKYLDKIDCVICKNVEEDFPDNGKVVNNAFVMRNPNSGSIGAILSSPAKMLSGRVYTKVEITEQDD